MLETVKIFIIFIGMVDVGLLEMSVLVVVVGAVAEVIAVAAVSTIAVVVTFVATVHSVEEGEQEVVVVDSKELLVLLGTDVVPVVIETFAIIAIEVLVTVIVVSVIRVFVIRNVILENWTAIVTWNVDQALAVAIAHLVIVR